MSRKLDPFQIHSSWKLHPFQDEVQSLDITTWSQITRTIIIVWDIHLLPFSISHQVRSISASGSQAKLVGKIGDMTQKKKRHLFLRRMNFQGFILWVDEKDETDEPWWTKDCWFSKKDSVSLVTLRPLDHSESLNIVMIENMMILP